MLKNSLKTLHLHIFIPKLPSEIDVSENYFYGIILVSVSFCVQICWRSINILISPMSYIIKIHGDNLFLGSRSYPRSWPLSHQSHYNLTLNYDLKKFNFFFCFLERSGTPSYHMLLFHFFPHCTLRWSIFCELKICIFVNNRWWSCQWFFDLKNYIPSLHVYDFISCTDTFINPFYMVPLVCYMYYDVCSQV